MIREQQLIILCTFCAVYLCGVTHAVWLFMTPQAGTTSTTTMTEGQTLSYALQVYGNESATPATISLSGSNCAAAFNVQFTTYSGTTYSGTITSVNTFDYDTQNSFLCTVTATSSTPSATSSATVSISVTNIVNKPPIFSASSANCQVNEEQNAGTNPSCSAALGFTDGDKSGDSWTCQLVASAGSSVGDYTYFTASYSLVGTQQQCVLATTTKLDREKLSPPATGDMNSLKYYPILRVTDSGGYVASMSITITLVDIDDNGPVCPQSQVYVKVQENTAADSLIYTMNCPDPDSTSYNTVTYTYGSPTSSNVNFASPNFKTTSTALDYDQVNPNVVVYGVASSTTYVSTVSVSIIVTPVNDNVPVRGTWNPAYVAAPTPIASVSEAATAGTVLFTAKYTDADIGADGVLTYSIASATSVAVSGSTAQDMKPYITIDNTGQVQLSIANKLDRETMTQIQITVQVVDGGTTPRVNTVTDSVVVNITDSNEFPPAITPLYQTVSIPEAPAAGTYVGTIQAKDPDISQTVVRCYVGSGDTNGFFMMDPADNVTIRIAKSQRPNPDSPTSDPTSYNLNIICYDNNGVATSLSSTAVVAVNVNLYNNNTPSVSVSPNAISLPENSDVGKIADITVTDADAGVYGTVTCSLQGSYTTTFQVSSDCKQLLLIGALDYDNPAVTPRNYALFIQAVDGGSLAGYGNVTVTVTDVNDNLPRCATSAQSASLIETSPLGTFVVLLSCTDVDNSLSYTINNYPSGPFTIASNGSMTTNGVLDYDAGTRFYSLNVYVAETGITASSTIYNYVFVTVTRANEFTPNFTTTPTFTVAENITAGTIIGTVVAQDADASPDNVVAYSIVSVDGVSSGLFSIYPRTGDIYLSTGQALDYETMVAPKYYYVLVVTATDGAGAVGTGTCTISVTNVNDNVPTFQPNSVYTGSVSEDGGTTSGTLVTVNATDKDVGAVIKYTLMSGPGSSYFSITSDTGLITRSGTTGLNYDTTKQVKLLIQATDSLTDPIFTATATVLMAVTDFNGGTPSCSPPLSAITVAENLDLGSLLLNLSSICTDSDLSQTLSYTQSAAVSYFSVDNVRGNINLVSNLNYEASTSATFYVIVADNGSPVKSSTATLQVTVTNYNEFVPLCTGIPPSISVPESTATFTTLLTISNCIDGDKDDTQSFAIVSVNGAAGTGPFSIVASTGVISLGGTQLDYETTTQHTVVITVTDSLTSPQRFTSTYTLIVQVTNVNESPPVLGITSATASIAENSPIGTALSLSPAGLSATDPDRGGTDGTFGFYLLSALGNASSGYFQVAASSGAIQVARPLDRETAASLVLYVVARDGGNLQSTATATIAVTVTDVNDNAPQFSTTQRTVNIFAGAAANSMLFDFSSDVTDADAGTNAVISLSLPASPSQFSLGGTGNRQLLTTAVMPQTPTLYTVLVQASDGGSPSLSSTCTVTVMVRAANLNAPLFTNSGTSVTLLESTTVGQIVYAATSSDADPTSPENWRNYSMGYDTSNGNFRVDSATGQVYLIKALDYETAAGPFNISLRVQDGGTPSLSSTISLIVTVVDVNDNAPTFASNNVFQWTKLEDTAVSTNINTVLWNDKDSGVNGQVICSITTQTGNYLTIDPTTCVISIVNALDRETIALINILVRLTDKGTPALSSEKMFLLTVGDVNDNTPTFKVSNLAVNIDENNAFPATLTNALATDADAGVNAQIVYTLTGNFSANFNIDTSGVVTVQAALDREQIPRYNFTITATDQGTYPGPLSSSYSLVISVNDLNDNSPVVFNNPYSISIAESDTVFVNYALPKIIATDADSIWGVLTYSIASVTPASNNFVINNATGQLRLAAGALFNREDGTAAYTISVKVNDNGFPTANSAFATVTVTITDVNDNPPIFSPSSITVTVSENVAVGTSLTPMLVNATDADVSSPNNVVKYYFDSMVQGNPFFSVNTSGALQVATAAIDRESRSVYIMRIKGVDQGTPSLTGTATVTISILDVNDNNPIFTSTYFNASVPENSPSGRNVLQLTATDADIGANAIISYSIDTSQAAGALAATLFAINSATGQISVTGSLDYESTKFYIFPVQAVDGGTPSLSSTSSVYVTITDVNDNAPVLSPSFYSGEVPTIDDGSARIADVNYTDVDTGLGGIAKFSWSTSITFFNVDPDNGYVTKAPSMSIVAGTKYVQYVQATDQGTPNITSTTPATVRIDAFQADDYIVKITFTMSQRDFNFYLYQIRESLRNVLSAKYPNNRVGTWKSDDQTSSTLGYFYAVANRYADAASNVTNVTKEFVPASDLLAMWRLNSDGVPTSPLVGAAFTSTPITKVEPYTVVIAPPWYQTTAGIVGLTLGSIGAALLLGGAAVGLYFLCNTPAAPYTSMPAQPAPVAKVAPVKPQKIIDLNEAKHPNKVDKVPMKTDLSQPSQQVNTQNLEAFENVYEPSFQNSNYMVNENTPTIQLDF